jgi:hypothetical protein
MATTQASSGTGELEAIVASITEVLLQVASGNFAARAPRNMKGDVVDVLAFLVNATAEEVEHLVSQLREEREELRRTRDRLILSDRLSALGRLASGVRRRPATSAHQQPGRRGSSSSARLLSAEYADGPYRDAD